jgi:dTDP-4-dehydrorhamnose reductase
MRIALLGAGGQLATDLRPQLRGDVVPLARADLDVTHEDDVAARFADIRPDLVLNCTAMTNVDACETQPAAAFAVNAEGAGAVARQAARLAAAVLYVSTDYVYGQAGPRAEPYVEDDPPGPVNVYGASKLAGEMLTRANNPRYFIVRTCGLYGHAGAHGKGGNFVETMLRAAQTQPVVRVVADQRLSPTSTRELAVRIAQLIRTGAFGLVHIAAPDHCTWFEFTREIFAHAGVKADLRPILSNELRDRAPRPTMSALQSVRLASTGVSACPPWRQMLHAYLDSRPQSQTI